MKPRTQIARIGKKKLASLGGKMPFSSIPRDPASPRKAVRKSKRKPSEFARIYGSKARVEWVKSLPCAACGVVGFSENAHVAPPGEKGTGYKAGYEWIVPLCGAGPAREVALWTIYVGCHWLYDNDRSYFDTLFPAFNAEASKVQIAWLSIKGE